MKEQGPDGATVYNFLTVRQQITGLWCHDAIPSRVRSVLIIPTGKNFP